MAVFQSWNVVCSELDLIFDLISQPFVCGLSVCTTPLSYFPVELYLSQLELNVISKLKLTLLHLNL